MLATLKIVAENEQQQIPAKRMEYGKGRNKGVVELKGGGGGNLRLFGFFHQQEFLICTNTYVKRDSSSSKQDEAFRKCRDFRDLFLRKTGGRA